MTEAPQKNIPKEPLVTQKPKKLSKQTKQAVQNIITKIEHNNSSILGTTFTAPAANENKGQLTLEPSMHFMKHIQSEEQQPYYKTLHKPQTVQKQKLKKRNKIINQQNTIEEEYIDIDKNRQKNVRKTIREPKSVISIKRRESQSDIKGIITRFKKSNNPALSLFVAKKSYELGNYEQAYNYALITNGIDNDIEESWLIFAKSLVKLGKPDMAAKTLRKYIQYSHSGNAKILLNDIESGKFR
jgi:hypothetical protein